MFILVGHGIERMEGVGVAKISSRRTLDVCWLACGYVGKCTLTRRSDILKNQRQPPHRCVEPRSGIRITTCD